VITDTTTVTPAPEQRGDQQPREAAALEQLVAKHGVKETATYERLLGSGMDLWADDREFDQFQEHLRAIRRERD